MLREYLKPIIYNDETLGDFLYNRALGSFDKNIAWTNNKNILLRQEQCEGHIPCDDFQTFYFVFMSSM